MIHLRRTTLPSLVRAGTLAGLFGLAVGAHGQTTLFSEDFESVKLGPKVDEGVAGDAVWSKTPPGAWKVDSSGVAGINEQGVGVTEWKGWTFAKKEWWSETAGNQRRAEFTKGVNVVAVADPDEWDDLGSPAAKGTFNSFLKTPEINVAGLDANTVELVFDSAFRPEGNQTASVTVSYDGGAAITILEWVATEDNKTNETITVNLKNPATAKKLVVTFGMTKAVNNWYWAIDNIKVTKAGPLFAENFEKLTLGLKVDEGFEAECAKPITVDGVEGCPVWTNKPPSGWTIDNSKLWLGEDPNEPVGVTEWRGWAFANKDWWAETAADQRRKEWTKGQGTVAIADPDEWDDKGDPDAGGKFNSFMSSSPISLAGVAPSTLVLKFDSSWRPEAFDDGPDKDNNQTATIEVAFDGGAKTRIMRWSSDSADKDFHDDNSTNETVILPIANPAGAKTMVVTFGLINSANDWWWAVDNIEIAAGAAILSEVTPRPNRVTFVITDSGASKINTDTLKVQIDGQDAATSVTKDGSKITLVHNRATAFIASTTHPYVITGKTAAGGDVKFEGTFTAPAPTLSPTPLAGPAGSAGKFGVRYIYGTGESISGVVKANAVIAAAGGANFAGKKTDTTHSFIDHGNGGFMTNNLEYAEAATAGGDCCSEDFIMLSKASIQVTEAGLYTFGVHSDDGFALRIFGVEFLRVSGAGAIDIGAPNTVMHAADTGDSNTRAVVELKPGVYDLEFFWWERGGGDFGELYVAKGEFAQDVDTKTWQLIGDPGVANPFLKLVAPGTSAAPVTLLFEDFEKLKLGPSVDEGVAGDAVWTKTSPPGWTVDSSGVAGINEEGVGVTEWKGWNFANKDWWAETAGDQRRKEFTKGVGTVAVADPDEWDDKGGPAAQGTFNSFLKTPEIDVSAAAPNTVKLTFDSAFRPEGQQTASVAVSFDGGAAKTLFEWVNTPDNKTNETIVVPIENPAGAKKMVIIFGMTKAVNNWYWAIDNIRVERPGGGSTPPVGGTGPGTVVAAQLGTGGADFSLNLRLPSGSNSATAKGVLQRSADLKTWTNVTDAAQKDLGGGVLQITGKRTANAKAEFFRAGVQ